MCSGVVPQQPPRIRAPAASMRGVIVPKYSGLAAKTKRPSSRCDRPAFGMIRRAGSPSAGGPIASSASRHGVGPGSAVHPDDVGAGPSERRRGFRRPAAVDEDPLLAERERRDDGQVRCAPRLVDGDEQGREIGERLEDDRVDPAFEQSVDLLPERRPDVRLRDGRPAARRRPERPHGPADERIASADLPRGTGELRGPPAELAGPALEPPRREPPSIGAERQGLDQLGAGLEVLPVGGADELRLADDQLLETGALGHAAAEQEGAQPAVDEERPRREPLPEARPRQAGRRFGRQAASLGLRNVDIARIDMAPRGRSRRSGDRRNGKTLPARKGPGRSLIAQASLPGIGTLPARRR